MHKTFTNDLEAHRLECFNRLKRIAEYAMRWRSGSYEEHQVILKYASKYGEIAGRELANWIKGEWGRQS